MLILSTLILFLCSSCHTTRYIPMPSSHTRDSTHLTTDHRYDSIYIDRWHTLILRGDTVFKTDSIYVEKLRDIELHDTIRITRHDSIPYPVEVPVEVPVPIPRLYRSCTVGFFLILIARIAFIALRLYLRR